MRGVWAPLGTRPQLLAFWAGIRLNSFFSKEYDRSSNKVLTIPYGLVARIAGFHPAGSGSIPGMGNYHNVFHERTFIFAFQLARIMLSKDFHVQVSTEYWNLLVDITLFLLKMIE